MRLTWTFGLPYGIALLALGVFAAGAGHGSLVPLLLFSSPLALLGVAEPAVPDGSPIRSEQAGVAMVLAIPLLWLVLAYLAERSANDGAARGFRAGMLLHYAAAVWLLLRFGDWEYLGGAEDSADPAGLAFLVYAGGQAVLWTSHVAARRRRDRSP